MINFKNNSFLTGNINKKKTIFFKPEVYKGFLDKRGYFKFQGLHRLNK